MGDDVVKILREIISGARVCAQPQIPESLAKANLVEIANRLEELLAQAEIGGAR